MYKESSYFSTFIDWALKFILTFRLLYTCVSFPIFKYILKCCMAIIHYGECHGHVTRKQDSLFVKYFVSCWIRLKLPCWFYSFGLFYFRLGYLIHAAFSFTVWVLLFWMEHFYWYFFYLCCYCGDILDWFLLLRRQLRKSFIYESCMSIL